LMMTEFIRNSFILMSAVMRNGNYALKKARIGAGERTLSSKPVFSFIVNPSCAPVSLLDEHRRVRLFMRQRGALAERREKLYTAIINRRSYRQSQTAELQATL
jgi:hypothetical protein